MPFPNELSARQKDPSQFDKFRRVNKDKGVSIIYGINPDGSIEVQSIRFNTGLFTPSSAKQWLRERDMKTEIEESRQDSLDFKKVEAESIPPIDSSWLSSYNRMGNGVPDTYSIESLKDTVQDDWRYDAVEVEKFRVDSQGFLHVDEAVLSTVGVYKYRQGNKVVREFRPSSEVQSERFMKSLKNAVVTDEHPHPRGTPVTIKNVKRLQIGSTGSDVQAKGNTVVSSLVVTDSKVIQKILDRKSKGLRTGLSVGYRSKTRNQSGVWQGPNGPVPYDKVQYGHVANHICITVDPRGGLHNEGTILRLDSFGEGEQIPNKVNTSMETIKVDIGGVQIDVCAAHAPLLQDKLSKLDSLVEESKTQLSDVAKKLGASEAKIKELEEANTKLTVDSKVNIGKLVAERIELNESAAKLVDKSALEKLDSEDEDYEDKVITLCLDSHSVDLPKSLEGDALAIYKRATFDGLIRTASQTSHRKFSQAVNSRGPSMRTDSRGSDDRKNLNDRLKKHCEKLANPSFK